MDDNLFDDNEQPKTPAADPNAAPETFRVGDKDYTQAELNDLVARGNFAKEVEEKFNTKLDRVVPDYTRSTQETAELRRKIEAMEKADLDAKAQAGTLSREELIAQAKREAAGIGLMTDENTPSMIRTQIERYDLEKVVDSEVEDLAAKGINADPQVIIRYMDAANIAKPADAVNQLYGAQVKIWQDAELAKTKPESVYTQANGNAGGFKLPPDVKVNEDNLMELFKQSIGAEE